MNSFLYKNMYSKAFLCLQFQFFFTVRILSKKQKLLVKVLVKFRPGVNFINILEQPFRTQIPKASNLFTLLGSASAKAACKTLMKLTPGDVIPELLPRRRRWLERGLQQRHKQLMSFRIFKSALTIFGQ